MTDRPEGRPPLAGIRVLDFSRVFAGPYATMMLADLGAEVVKVEPPTGDEARYFGPPFLSGEGMNFLAVNRAKRGIVLDLKQPVAVEAAHRLASAADVVVENFRPGVADRLGIGYEDLATTNPGLIYCSISGFGPDSPWADRPAVDPVLQALGGLMEKQGHGSRPEWLCVAIADTYAASLAVQAILAALFARARDGGAGQRVIISLYEAIVAAQGYRMVTGIDRVELPAWDDTVPNGAYQASDGAWFVVTVATARGWSALCEAIGRPGLEGDSRFATNALRVEHKAALIPILEGEFRTRTAAEWVGRLGERGVPAAPVRTSEDVVVDASLERAGVIVRSTHPAAGEILTMGTALHLARTPVTAGGATPILGQHTREVLVQAGFSAREVDEMLSTGAAAAASQ